jgi:general secretion pathway protein B
VPTNALPEVPASPDSRGAIPLAQLSPEQRRDWPVFKLGGTVWSESPASRFVIANGQLVREGEAVVPGLVLERITPKTLLLRWRGLQVVMPH